MPKTPAELRVELAATLSLDLVGPSVGHPLEAEELSTPPARWYLTGFLVPYEAPETQREDPTANEQIGVNTEGGGADDDDEPEQASARRAHFPSSLGLSVLVPEQTKTLQATASWGDYKVEAGTTRGRERTSDQPPQSQRAQREVWKRSQRVETIVVPLRRGRRSYDVLGSDGLRVVVSVRRLSKAARDFGLDGASTVSIFLVNHRQPVADASKDVAFAFQAGLRVDSETPFCGRPNVRGRESSDWDDKVADLQYRSAHEYAVGHGVSTHAEVSPDGRCRSVLTTWTPMAEVEKVIPGAAPAGACLGMETLAGAASAAALAAMLRPLVAAYGQWIAAQRREPLDHPRRKEVATELMQRAEVASRRVSAGIDRLERDPQTFEAFRIANRAMAAQARRRMDGAESEPTWRPFQLAFVLLNLEGIAEPQSPERETVDLLFFPTGGGKTEAYLGLAAFTLVLRRLRRPGLSSAGVTVLMRYTLRLLTLDQLGRAAALICALELERQKDPVSLGPWPFEIGLWVGQAATPNRMGKKGDNDRYSARARVIAFQNDDGRKPSPIPLGSCPWCKKTFKKSSFVLLAGGRPNADKPTDLRVYCADRDCAFSGRRQPLPIVAVDEPIYRRLPSFLIATVDKFASLPWVGPTGMLLGGAVRHDADGFYGPADPQAGRPLPEPLLPPDLVVQDELHLISGPLGTMVGLYETVIDRLATRQYGNRRVRPKIVASTATVRRAAHQIRALFTRPEVEVFPPPGPNARDSYFAKTVPSTEQNARLYVGVAAQGRSAKVLLLRTYLGLLAAAQHAYEEGGGDDSRDNPADPYMSLLGYFNSLRELGGSRRIVEDEVRSQLSGYHQRSRPPHLAFSRRRIAYDVVELTSREPTSKVAETKRRLELPFHHKDRIDVALATNMISVGLDITRLGLMVVLGQPKTTAEYIQATSRVGRDEARPGLIVALLNVHRPRDRSHYERFEAYHASFYRSVEATSVTPFSPRAVDRGLAGVTVALARHGQPELTEWSGAGRIGKVRTKLGFVGEAVAARFRAQDPDRPPADVEDGASRLRAKVDDLLDGWARLAHDQEKTGAGFQYQREHGGPPPLLYDPLDPELATKSDDARKFRVQRSLRDVEPSVNLWVHTLDGARIDPEEAEG